MGFTADLLAGVAGLLAGQGVGAWRPDGIYGDGDVGIYLGVVPQSGGRLITLTCYPRGDDPALSDSMVGLQVRARSSGRDLREATDLADRCFDALQALAGVVLPTGVRLSYVGRLSGAPMGVDEHGRWEHADNYQLAAWRPSPHRI
jgi:hypothetical protein